MLAWEVTWWKNWKFEMHQKSQKEFGKVAKNAKCRLFMQSWNACQVSIFGASPSLREIHHVSNTSNIFKRNQSCLRYLKYIIYHKYFIELKASEQCLKASAWNPPIQPGRIHIWEGCWPYAQWADTNYPTVKKQTPSNQHHWTYQT